MQTRILFSFVFLTACNTETPAPATPMTPLATVITPEAPASVVTEGASFDCANSEIVVTEGADTIHFRRGRTLGSDRGASVPYAEIVIHPGTMNVFDAEGIAPDGQRGSVNLQASRIEPSKLDGANVENGSIEYTRPGANELAGKLPIQLDRFGEVGEAVEGTAGPVEIEGKTISVRFRVCRTNDWVVKK